MDTFIKTDERKHRKEFLSLMILVFTLLIGSSGMQGNTLYYLSFLAGSLYYYLMLERKRVNSLLMILLPFFVGMSFTGYLSTVYSANRVMGFVDFNPLLYAMILAVVFVGLLPENVRSEWKKKITSVYPQSFP